MTKANTRSPGEMTKYIDEELQCVERLVGKLSTQRKEGKCDNYMAGTIDHLIEELLFLRACLHSHPPYLPNHDAAYRKSGPT